MRPWAREGWLRPEFGVLVDVLPDAPSRSPQQVLKRRVLGGALPEAEEDVQDRLHHDRTPREGAP